MSWRRTALAVGVAALAGLGAWWWGQPAEPEGAGVVLAPREAPSAARASPPVEPQARSPRVVLPSGPADPAQARLQRAERTLQSYREATRYPHESRPINEHPDQVHPFAPIPGELPLRMPGDRESAGGVRLVTTQERVFVSGAETVRFTVAAVDEGGRTLPLLINRAVAFDLPDPRQAAGRPPAPVPFTDAGQGPDTQAGDGVWSAVFSPATQGFADYAGTLRVQLDLNQNGRRGQLGFDVVYEPAVPGEWGGVTEALHEGSLDFVLGLVVKQPGRYVVSGRAYDAQGKPFALLSFNEELAAGPQQVRLQVFGKLVRDAQPALPLTLRDVEGFLLYPDRFPDRAMLPRRAGVLYTSRITSAGRFGDAEWQSEERQRYLDELARDVAAARGALPAPAPGPRP